MFVACGGLGLGAAAMSIYIAPGLPGLLGAALAAVMLAIAVSDVRTFIIPDVLIVAALGLGLVDAAASAGGAIVAAVASAVLRGIVLGVAFWALRVGYRRLRGREGIGLGDVKLAIVAGVWLDWLPISIAVEIAALAALAAVAVLALRGRRITARTRLPFGSFFAPAIWIAWLLSQSLFPTLF